MHCKVATWTTNPLTSPRTERDETNWVSLHHRAAEPGDLGLPGWQSQTLELAKLFAVLTARCACRYQLKISGQNFCYRDTRWASGQAMGWLALADCPPLFPKLVEQSFC